MTRSHAKNTHTQSILSSHERAQIRGETSSKRIGAESFKPFDSCYLCLSTLVSPVSCSRGHMYCRECALSNLISQKAGIEVQRRELARWDAREEEERREVRERVRERVLRDFEKGMALGAPGSGSGQRVGVVNGSGNGNGDVAKGTTSGEVGARLNGAKMEQKDIDAATALAEEKALQKIQAEQVENRKSKLAAFWLPSLAPEAVNGKTPIREKDIKLQTLCHFGGEPHPFSRKTLLPVNLHYPSSSKTPHCPSCARELSNTVSSFLLSSREPAAAATNGEVAAEADRPAKKQKKSKKEDKDKEAPLCCGHVVCQTCVDTIVKPSERCSVCEAGIKGDGAGIIPVGKDGTGFAAAGGAEVRDSSAILFRMG